MRFTLSSIVSTWGVVAGCTGVSGGVVDCSKGGFSGLGVTDGFGAFSAAVVP